MSADDDFEAARARAKAAGHRESPWALLSVLAVMAVGAGVVATSHWRRGAFIIGCSVALAAVLRAVLPGRLAGLLVVRSRWFDLACLVGAAAAIFAVTLIVPPSPPR